MASKSNNIKYANVFHSELWGVREVFENQPDGQKKLISGKYHSLNENNITTTKWKKLSPQTPFYLFIPQNTKLLKEYETGWIMKEIMPINVAGLYTSRDHFCIQYEKEKIWKIVKDFITLSSEDARVKYQLGKDVQDWKVNLAQKDIKQSGPDNKYLSAILYRPFDMRWTYYTGNSRGFICRPRSDVMRNMLKSNMAVFIGRQGQAVGTNIWDLLFCGETIEDFNLFRRGNNICFPLYLYPKSLEEAEDLLDISEAVESAGGRKPNLSPEFIEDVSERLKLSFIQDGKGNLKNTFGPEDVFHYMYGVFHSPTYRSRYAEFLKIDFPRLPLTSDIKLFRELCKVGERLKDLHLMEGEIKTITTYPQTGDNTVDKLRYDEERERIYINKEQYFGNVPRRVWVFHVGGYQVCSKWLKDRKGRQLSYDDLTHYQRIVASLDETIDLMSNIDNIIEKNGGWPIN